MGKEYPGEIITLKSEKGHVAKVSKYAAHLLSWTDHNGQEALFVSEKAIFAPPKAIRGGVPICFPQFGSLGPLKTAHGFARNSSEWEVLSAETSSTTLLLRYDGADASFPFPFELRCTVSLLPGGELEETLKVTNTGSEQLPFTGALHTYYRVADVDAVRVRGLGNVPYEDSLQARALMPALDSDAAAPIVIDKEVDRIYKLDPKAAEMSASTYTSSASFEIEDPGNGRVFRIQTRGFPDAVLWNPWIEKSKAFADFDDLEFRQMICLEPAVAASGPLKLDPGSNWVGSQKISVVQKE